MPAPKHTDLFSRDSITTALSHWEKLEELGNHPLTHLRIVEARREADDLPGNPKGRGLALQRILRELTDAFKPTSSSGQNSNEPDYADEAWQAYIILTEAFIRGAGRSYLADALNVSERQYYRLQREVLKSLTDQLWELEQHHNGSPETQLDDTPSSSHFIGRTQELAYYCERLERDHLAIITGLAGTGKTALGAVLAGKLNPDAPVFWLTFRPGINTDVDSVLQKLANFLRENGAGKFWDYLRVEVEAGKRHPPQDKMSHLISGLKSGSYILCIDNCELVNHDPGLTQLFQVLREKASRAGQIDLILDFCDRDDKTG